ncbi:nucleotidyl transferase AbiEii/AbiGii toxin family protein [Blautia coccoides]|uniref:Nucleotidyltransferase AbiEii toxin of type IV toxin-antitoxin system n=1 Tax=Blautia producta TaxID=33035 RepID=A0ABZ0U576_9FIRM|nr:nucleotidyl transferase AbiEii/AbiGii toxin family protein [Blautia coccoides]MCR1989871.1 nucleotidyl transferase AbiEii/AbiGii toxin family protein [Blautia coccoides]TCO52249.1 nucleotidyltransferase AbiEii toxin of type IV toxin-antitoxin system [Blautia coccoides]WPX72372.1 hypothetical protein BLCOC_07080 [Blautia coccoides]SUY05813.1 Nucleotidyl transferase of uncharacterised function (DUF1814) [Blautia coccoides]
MLLHEDKETFEELIGGASDVFHIPAYIIEKDYYVTLVLRELSNRIPDMVFKGGTSLSKCYQLIDRFSEDIDLSYTASSGVPGESRKRRLKKGVIESIEALGFCISNLEETRSRRNYNCYKAAYSSQFGIQTVLKPELVIETYVALLPFPTCQRPVDSYLHKFLDNEGLHNVAEEYQLLPFPIITQEIERTLIDKIFAICDYYLDGQISRHSRHLYDIHKILQTVSLADSFPALVKEVRQLREPLPNCPSAKEGIEILKLLTEILEREIYKEDYETITKGLLFQPVSYDEVCTSLKDFINKSYF